MSHASGTSHAGSVLSQAVTHLLCAARFDRVRPEVTRRVFRDPSPRHPLGIQETGIGIQKVKTESLFHSLLSGGRILIDARIPTPDSPKKGLALPSGNGLLNCPRLS